MCRMLALASLHAALLDIEHNACSTGHGHACLVVRHSEARPCEKQQAEMRRARLGYERRAWCLGRRSRLAFKLDLFNRQGEFSNELTGGQGSSTWNNIFGWCSTSEDAGLTLGFCVDES